MFYFLLVVFFSSYKFYSNMNDSNQNVLKFAEMSLNPSEFERVRSVESVWMMPSNEASLSIVAEQQQQQQQLAESSSSRSVEESRRPFLPTTVEQVEQASDYATSSTTSSRPSPPPPPPPPPPPIAPIGIDDESTCKWWLDYLETCQRRHDAISEEIDTVNQQLRSEINDDERLEPAVGDKSTQHTNESQHTVVAQNGQGVEPVEMLASSVSNVNIVEGTSREAATVETTNRRRTSHELKLAHKLPSQSFTYLAEAALETHQSLIKTNAPPARSSSQVRNLYVATPDSQKQHVIAQHDELQSLSSLPLPPAPPPQQQQQQQQAIDHQTSSRLPEQRAVVVDLSYLMRDAVPVANRRAQRCRSAEVWLSHRPKNTTKLSETAM